MEHHLIATGDFASVSINEKIGSRAVVLYLYCLYDWFAQCINLK